MPSPRDLRPSGGLPLLSAAALCAAGLLAFACTDDLQGPGQEGVGPASVAVRASIEAGGDTASQAADGSLSAYNAADEARVRLTEAGSGDELVDRTVSFEPGEGAAVGVQVPLDEERVSAELTLALRASGAPVFEGTAPVELAAGERTEAEPTLVPVPAELSIAPSPVTLEALGEELGLSATARFATGDEIPGAAPEWSSADPSVAEVGPDGTVVARAPGQAPVTAALEDVSASVTVTVDPVAAAVAVEPGSVRLAALGESRTFEASVTDANGHPVADAAVTWSSTDPAVVRVDADGTATAVGAGTADVVAEAMGASGAASAAVEIGPTGRLAGQVGEVLLGATGSAPAALSAPGGPPSASLETSGLGGVTVEFRQGGAVVSSTTTGPDGSWTSPRLPPGTYDVRYVREGFVDVTQPGLELVAGETGSVASVPMVPGSDQPGTMAGRVLAAGSGSGLEGVAVALRPGVGNTGGAAVATATTGAEGAFRFEGAAAGTYTVTATGGDLLEPGSITGVVAGGRTVDGQDLELPASARPVPTIEAPADGSVFPAGTSVTLEGAATDEEDGDLSGDALRWTSDIDGDLGTGTTVEAGLSGGPHTVTLTATDSDGATGEASIGVRMNRPPEATISAPGDGAVVPADEPVELAGSAADAHDGDLSGDALAWRSDVDGPLGTGGSVTADLSAGAHTLTLTATDSDGATDEASVGITVNRPPTATIRNPADGASFLEGKTIRFEGSGDDPEDGALEFGSLVWHSSIDGNFGTGEAVTTDQLSPGSHTITLTATDSDGATGEAQISVTVQPGSELAAFAANDGTANRVYANDGSGSFTDDGQALGSNSSNDVALGDVDGDGDLDAFVVNTFGGNRVYRNDGSGGFTDTGQTLGSNRSFDVDLGDVDGDGDLDAVVANDGAASLVYRNDGSGNFTDSGQTLGTSGEGATASFAVGLGDLDGDGDLDAFIGNNGDANRVYRNDGSGSFTDTGQSLGLASTVEIALGDVDGDGDLDAFVANGFGAVNRVYRNDGSGGFTDTGQTLGSHDSVGLALGDLDGDGDLDAFVGNDGDGETTGTNRVYRNDGSGNFTDTGQALGTNRSFAVALGDLDGDDTLDAFVGNFGGGNRVYRNDGSGNFTDTLQSLGTDDTDGVALGDLSR